MELMLGLPPMTQYDAGATPMINSFMTEPDLRPYNSVGVHVDLAAKNPPKGKGAQASLPVFVFQGAGSSSQFDVQRAWAAALTLVLIVAILYVSARVLTRRNALDGR